MLTILAQTDSSGLPDPLVIWGIVIGFAGTVGGLYLKSEQGRRESLEKDKVEAKAETKECRAEVREVTSLMTELIATVRDLKEAFDDTQPPNRTST